MSLLITESYANSTTPLWAPASIGNLPSQVFQYALPSGTPGGVAPNPLVYYTRPINQGIPALDVDGYSIGIPGCRLLNNEIILPPGTYFITANVVGLMLTQKARIFDVTNNVVLAIGMSVGAETRNNESSVSCEVTFTETTTIAIQFCGSDNFGGNAQCWGQPCSFGDDEVYLQCYLTKEN